MEEGIPVWKCLVLIVRGVGTMVEGCVELVGRVVARERVPSDFGDHVTCVWR